MRQIAGKDISFAGYGLSGRLPIRLLVPWLAFWLVLSLSWRLESLFNTVPTYGDVLDVLWGIEWYAGHFPRASLLTYPLIFHPEGWQVMTFAYGPGLFLLTLPLQALAGAAFAYNAAAILSGMIAFGGMLRTMRALKQPLFLAILAALLYTFWPFRWLRLYGHMNIMLGSSVLPWMVWSLWQGYHSSLPALGPRRISWFVLAGLCWAIAISCALYFVWIGALILAALIFGHYFAGRGQPGGRAWQWLLASSGLTMVTALIASSPVLFLFWQASRQASASLYDIAHINHWGASINSLPIPYPYHPWLGELARQVYSAPIDESGIANLGLLASILALLGLVKGWHERKWWPFHLLLGTGVIFALGTTLKWNGEPVEVPLFRPLNGLLWRLGATLKPDLFTTAGPPPSLAHAVPLPGLLLAAVLPFWEGARVLSRYMLVAGPTFFLLVARGLAHLRWPLLQLFIGCLLILEILTPTENGVPFPPPQHPAFAWLRSENAPEGAIVDLVAAAPETLSLTFSGETLWATRYHRRPTVSGASGIWPARTWILRNWLYRPGSYADPELAQQLANYDASLLLLHMQGPEEKQILAGLQRQPDLELIACFAGPARPSPWSYPICALAIGPDEGQ